MAHGFLAVDAGNTRLKATWLPEEGEPGVWHFGSEAQDELLALIERYAPDGAAMASVGHTDTRLVESLRMALGGNFLLLTPETLLPIRVRYDNPRTLGIDRKATAVAAAAEWGGSRCLVIDAGTALTCDVVADGEFLEGSISPGLQMRFRALHEFTALLPEIDVKPGDEVGPAFGQSTLESIRTGVLRGYMDEVCGAITGRGHEYSGTTVALITGGDAPLIMRRLDEIRCRKSRYAEELSRTEIVYDPYLLAKGLRAIYRHNENEI
ncbi:MAG: type III pantothenate kinase [Muribaculaceae bacterium]|nr:type III pantothenate kinase [Muribaculaceae bacterium]